MISTSLHISAHPRALLRSWVNTRAVHRARRCASAAGTGPGPVSDATVPEGHKSLHSFLYGNDADTAHAAAEYTPVQGEDDGAALLPVPEYLAGRRARGGAAVPGAYAVHDVSGTLQYVGFSRDVCKALQAHLTALGPERVSSVRVRVPPSRMMPTRAALAALAAEWLSDPSAPELPPGNGGPDAALWGGARDAGLLDAASREEHEGRKLRLQKAMGESLEAPAAEPDAERRRAALLAAVKGDDWSAVVSEQTAEALAGAVRAGSTGTSTSTTMAANEAAPALPASGAPGLSAVAATSPPSGPMISPFAQPGVHRRVGEGTPASSTHASTTAGTQQQQQQKPPPPVMDAASVDAALDEVRPYLLADGGDVNVVDVTDGVVRVALVGACSSCASSSATLKMGIERQLRAVFGDQLEQVLQVLDAGAGRPAASVEAIDMHLNMLRSAVAGMGGAVQVASVGGGVAVLQYKGPPALAKGVTAAVKDAFPDVKEVVLRDFPSEE